MRKTLMAAAVAGALTAPGVALAQTSTVQIFGLIHVLYNRQNNFTAANGNVPNVDHLAQSDSELGFRGEEQLGGGLSAWFQCASTFDVVGTGGTTGAANWCGRNSAVGFKGGWGNAFFGNWDTPEKLMIAPIRGWWGFGNILGGLGNNLTNGGPVGVANSAPGAAGAVNNAGYARRQIRMVNYHSPTWSGFQVLGAYSVANEATASTSGQTANKARLWSAAGTYSSGPIYAGIAYERHHNYNPGVGVGVRTGAQACTVGNYCGGNDYKWGIGGAYTFAGVAKLSGIYNWFKYDTTNGTDMKARTWGVYLDWTIAGPHSIKAGYTQLRDTKGNFVGTVGFWTANAGGGNTSSKLYNLAYAYGFSKRTTAYIGLAHVDNDSASAVPLPGGPRTPIAGENHTAWGLGLRHSF